VPEKNGEPDATLEISPLYAATEEQLVARGAAPLKIDAAQSVYFDEKGPQFG
jgi:hypothetical protein